MVGTILREFLFASLLGYLDVEASKNGFEAAAVPPRLGRGGRLG